MPRDIIRARKREKEWQTDHAMELREYHRWKHIKKAYGITKEDWLDLFRKQNYCCATCKRIDPDAKIGWCTDHIHGTKIVRGILCHRCNIVLHKGISSTTLRQMAEYVEK